VPAGGEGKRIVYGIRPEHFSLGGPLQAKVSVVEPTGSETQVFAQIGEQKLLGVFRERVTVAPGQILPLAPNVEAVHLFDAQTGLRLN
jgi:multiple sugar transport system ATP-binding protein